MNTLDLATTDPWDRREGETAKAFAAFAAYRDMGANRSLTKVARLLHEGGTPEPPALSTIGEWSSKHRWQERVTAWDISEDRRRREERAQQQREMEERHLAASSTMIFAALARLRGLEREGAPNVLALDPNEMDWNDLVRVLSEAWKIDRITRGLPTDVSRHLHSVSLDTAGRLARTLVEGALSFIEEDKQAAWVMWATDVCQNVQP